MTINFKELVTKDLYDSAAKKIVKDFNAIYNGQVLETYLKKV